MIVCRFVDGGGLRNLKRVSLLRVHSKPNGATPSAISGCGISSSYPSTWRISKYSPDLWETKVLTRMSDDQA